PSTPEGLEFRQPRKFALALLGMRRQLRGEPPCAEPCSRLGWCQRAVQAKRHHLVVVGTERILGWLEPGHEGVHLLARIQGHAELGEIAQPLEMLAYAVAARLVQRLKTRAVPADAPEE